MTDRLTNARNAIGAAFISEGVTTPPSRSAYAALTIASTYPVMKVRRIFGSWDRAMKNILKHVRVSLTDIPVVAIPLVDQSVVQAATLAYTFNAGSFTDAESLTYAIVTKPDWVTFDGPSRTFGGTAPAFVGDATDISTVTVRATDAYGRSVDDSFTITVTAA